MSVDLLPPPGEFRTSEEVRDAQFAQKMARRRKLLLLWSAAVVLVVFLAAAKLLSAVVLNMAGSSAYEKQNYVTAADRFSTLEFFNVVQPWKAPFNEGTATYASGDFFAATTVLEQALAQVPKAPEDQPRGVPECMVRTNYSLALEGLGDEASNGSDFAIATDYYDQAQQMLADCAQSGNGGEQAQDAQERQQESQEESQQQEDSEEQQGGQSDDSGQDSQEESPSESPQENQSPSSGDSGEDSSASPSTNPRQEELEERNREAQESREAQEQKSGGGDGSGQNW
ncbi:MAG TPA: hypothetical protein VK086_05685 [Ruania sp.]|nr:hypothetical protein [Ruania sp.]